MGQDIRVDLANIFAKAQHLIKKETELKLEIIYLLGELKEYNAGSNLGFFEKDYIQALGLTPDQYYKRMAAYQALTMEPAFKEMINSGKIHLTHLAMIAPKLTEANRAMIVEYVPNKSKRELEAFLSTVTPDGKIKPAPRTVEVRIKLTEDQFAMLERARDILSAGGRVVDEAEVVVCGLEDLLNKRDPFEKAKRAACRKRNSTSEVVEGEHSSVPGQAGPKARRLSVSLSKIEARQRVANSAKHLVWLKYEKQCGFRDAKGRRCPESRMLEIDHILPRCRGGDNSIDNLRLLCRSHNQLAARELLGGRECWLSPTSPKIANKGVIILTP